MKSTDPPTRAELEREVDRVLDGSFPASDPPPWTFGTTAPDLPATTRRTAGVAPSAVDVIATGHRHGFAAVVEAMGLVALLPLGVMFGAFLVWAGRAALASMMGR